MIGVPNKSWRVGHVSMTGRSFEVTNPNFSNGLRYKSRQILPPPALLSAGGGSHGGSALGRWFLLARFYYRFYFLGFLASGGPEA